jgi:hypothetical protein
LKSGSKNQYGKNEENCRPTQKTSNVISFRGVSEKELKSKRRNEKNLTELENLVLYRTVILKI